MDGRKFVGSPTSIHASDMSLKKKCHAKKYDTSLPIERVNSTSNTRQDEVVISISFIKQLIRYRPIVAVKTNALEEFIEVIMCKSLEFELLFPLRR